MSSRHPDLGQLTTRYSRDAIHMAVIPVTAGEMLSPGAHVCMDDSGKARFGLPDDAVGVVDPFLTTRVESGQRFWLLLNPGSITGLRHDWSHPDFPSSTDVSDEDREESEAWLRDFIGPAESFSSSFEEEIESILAGGSFTVYGREPDQRTPDHEFWQHLERFVGMPVSRSGNESFNCAC